MAALASIEREAAAETPVLLTGEAGTEKEAAARALHRLSRRGSEPFLTVPAGSGIPADGGGGGTLFLPDIERTSPGEQRDLVAELERPRGRRLVLSTDQDPREALEAGRLLPELSQTLSGHAVCSRTPGRETSRN
jgi:DNA-binding NtrC family response regulator